MIVDEKIILPSSFYWFVIAVVIVIVVAICISSLTLFLFCLIASLRRSTQSYPILSYLTPIKNTDINRHPDIPPVAKVAEGDVFRVECIDWTGGQIKNDDCSDDVKNVDLSQVHYLSGPIEIENAEVGDLLKVEILNLGCLDGDEWGFTGSFAQENGGGFLTDHYPKATKAIWDLEGIYCTSRHIPGIKFAGHIHPGT